MCLRPMIRSRDDPISRSPDLTMSRSSLLSSLATRVSGGAFADRGLPRRRFRRWQFSFVHREHERIRGVIGKYSDDIGRGSRRRRPGQRLLHTHMDISFVCGLVFFRDGNVDGISRRGDDLDAGQPYFHLFATGVLLWFDRRLPHFLGSVLVARRAFIPVLGHVLSVAERQLLGRIVLDRLARYFLRARRRCNRDIGGGGGAGGQRAVEAGRNSVYGRIAAVA